MGQSKASLSKEGKLEDYSTLEFITTQICKNVYLEHDINYHIELFFFQEIMYHAFIILPNSGTQFSCVG